MSYRDHWKFAPTSALVGLLLCAWCATAVAVEPTASELSTARAWTENAFIKTTEATPFFSFTVDGKPWQELAKDWRRTDSGRKLDDARTERTTVYTSPQGELEFRCVSVEYNDFPIVEWTLYFKNIGTKDSPIIADIRAIDATFKSEGKHEFLLHHQVGSPATLIDFAPRQTLMTPGGQLRFGGAGGRPTSSDWAYFNLEWDDQGLIVAVGWPGQWNAEFVRDGEHGLQLRAGQETTHFTIHPGEEFRSPLMVMQFWQDRDWIDAQNIWRRWMVKHNLPRPGGHDLEPASFACSSHQFGEMIGANEQNQIEFIDRYRDNGLPVDYWWMDAGWYACEGNWAKTGTWEVDPQRFPRGFRPISDHAHERDMKVLVWFEPERVAKGKWLMTDHPDWVIPSPNSPGETDNLLDLGNPDARRWLTDHVSQLIDDEGINLYRQDSNIDPLRFWTSRDSADRQGITENGHVRGYLAYWDELIRRHPNVPLDSCASGGRRNDLESMRRAVPRTRSDYLIEPIGEQCHTYGLAFWLPYYGTGFMDVVTEASKRQDLENMWISLSNVNSMQPTTVGESLATARPGRYGGDAYGLDDRISISQHDVSINDLLPGRSPRRPRL